VPSKSPIRVAVVAACLLIAPAIFAGTSTGSGTSPRALVPRLLAHDTSNFRGVARRPAKPGPQLLRAPRTRSTSKQTKLPFGIANDRALTDPDVLNPSGDMGKTQFLVGDHDGYAVFSRTWVAIGGAALAYVSRTSFWAGLGSNVPDAAGLCATNPQGEPSVAYDWNADRWVVTEAAYKLDGNNNPTGAYVQCVAVSTSSDATGTWSRYVYQISTSLYPEHPTLGVWSDGYYLSFDQHASDGTWSGAGALALERAKMLTGDPAQARYYDLENVTPALGGMLPASISGTNTPTAGAPELYLQAHDDPLNVHDRLEVWGFHVDWTVPASSTSTTFTPIDNIPLDTGGWGYRSLFRCAQPGTSNPVTFWSNCVLGIAPAGGGTVSLDPLSLVYSDSNNTDRLPQLGGHLQWSRSSGGTETLAATETQSNTNGAARPAWFKLQKVGVGSWGIADRGLYDPSDSTSRFLPSVAFDNSGNVGLGYVKTDDTIFATTAFTNASDSLSGETDVDAGNFAFTGSTFGGGTTLSLDPVDLCQFWFVGPISLTSGQTESIDNFSFPSCVASTTQPPLLTTNPSLFAPLIREGLTITGTPAAWTGATGHTYQWRRCDTHGMSCIDIPGANATTYSMTATDAAGDRTLRFQETDTNANGSSTAVSLDSTIVQSIPPLNDTRPSISGNAQSGQVLSTNTGSWTSSSPLSYTYRWRRCASVCTNIPGANASSYTLVDADVGSTVDVIVSATNTGGGTDANAPATLTVAAAPVAPPSGGGTSGGGTSGGGTSGGGTSSGSSGGGAGSPDLAITGFASNATPAVGDNVTLLITVTDKNSKPAQQLYVTGTLGSGLQYVSSSSDRGSGCSLSSGQLKCFLDYLSSDVTTAHLQIVAKVVASAQQTFVGTASAAQGEFNAADNTLSLTLNAAPPVTTTTTIATTTTKTTTGGTPTGLNGDGTPTKKQDKRKPTAQALLTPAKRGAVAKLRFKIYDDKGVAKALATVKHGSIVIGRASTGYGPVAAGSVYYVGWHVPTKAAKGHYSFCVTAFDRAGNKSAQSCAPLALK
jgi:uncharacterized repeat protein (TIGR01451 family)